MVNVQYEYAYELPSCHPFVKTVVLSTVNGEGESTATGSSSVNGGGWEGVSEPDWPEVDVIVGNPPFLGGKRMRTELNDDYDYVDALFKLYEGRVPHEADLVTYWFEKARAQIAAGKAKRAGLLSTNSIRGGANREVLKRIKDSGDIFMAWADREWVLDGAAVRVSMVGFDAGNESEKALDGQPVATINPDLTASVDITIAKRLSENVNIGFMGIIPTGNFLIDAETAKTMLSDKNTDASYQNSDVIKPYINGMDITRTSSDRWIIDFAYTSSLHEASKFESPMKAVVAQVKPFRDAHKTDKLRVNWWRFEASRLEMRKLIAPLQRYIVTPRVAKHRLFVWVESSILPDCQLIAIAREDDYFFGVLHSKIHEVWSLRMGTSLEDRPRYTPTTTFETFPFPWPPGGEPTSPPDPLSKHGEGEQIAAISAAAKQLHEEREAWLKGGGDDRTLTNLYNALNVFRGVEAMRIKPSAGDFAPRLDALHRALDVAVCDAYGWPHEVLDDDEAILARLLALNLERAGGA